MLTQIYNGNVLIPGGRWVRGGSVLIKDSMIAEIYSHSRILEGVDRAVNAAGGYILPGGIDIHVHGGGGRDFMKGNSVEMTRKAAQVCTALVEDPMSGVLGLHLEGPYFSPAMAGAQMPEIIRWPSPMEYIPLIEEFPCIRRWDAAPELPGAMDFARYITSKGVVAALGHTATPWPPISTTP